MGYFQFSKTKTQMNEPKSLQNVISEYWQLLLLIAIVVGGFYQLKLDIVRIEGKFEAIAMVSDRVALHESRLSAHDTKLVGIEKDIQRCVDYIGTK
jgi:hypothetical protein